MADIGSLVYFDIKQGDEDLGRIVVGLYGKVNAYMFYVYDDDL